ncbi:2,5-diketo-D-gluconic acid reductase-like protein [Peziza echinospora]|nr:2,5-diketo-D-gluconic acid reductase-like protein [Peziza echinospora]
MATYELKENTAVEFPHSIHTPKTKIPVIGFGVYKAVGGVRTILDALDAGYRHLDTAQLYENEAQVGEALRQTTIPREEIFVTTKIMYPVELSVEKTLESARESVRRIVGEDGYVDLFLVHNPASGPEGRKVLWTALELLQKEGRTKEIGVSNYGIKHLEELFTYCTTRPVCNQLELHPFCPLPAVVDFCQKEKIFLPAYSPLIRARRMDTSAFVEIAAAHNVSPAQVLVRWSLQKGFIPLPKSDDVQRIRANKDVFGFELSEAEMKKLEEVGRGYEDGQGAVCPFLVHVD